MPLPLLADVDGEVVEKYDVKSWVPGNAARAVVVIDEKGIVQHHNVQSLAMFRPSDSEVLTAIKSASS